MHHDAGQPLELPAVLVDSLRLVDDEHRVAGDEASAHELRAAGEDLLIGASLIEQRHASTGAEPDPLMVNRDEIWGEHLSECLGVVVPHGDPYGARRVQLPRVRCTLAGEVPSVELVDRVDQVVIVEHRQGGTETVAIVLGHTQEHAFEAAKVHSGPAQGET